MDASETEQEERHFGRIAAVYLIGLFVGGLYVGIIAPLRTVIQADFGLASDVGIWMVNIYTLFYAACIPAVGKLADRYGRARIFTACLAVFCIGSLLCGAAQFAGGFPLLILGRIVQAVGAGGIIPVATAEMGAGAPREKRGMWLGAASATAGLANVLGAAAGSAIISAVGAENWCWAFFICLPVEAALISAAFAWLPDHGAAETETRFDAAGSVALVGFVLLVLLGLKGIDFLNPLSTLALPGTWVPLALAAAVGLLLARVEHSADDPIFHSEYARNRNIVITMIASFFVGGIIISMVLIPEFAETALNLPVGSGGYYMAVLGVFGVVGPPVGGKIIDTRGPVPVLAFGLTVTAIGFAFLALFVAAHPSTVAMVVGLIVVGLGLGFAMGTPLNYMILQVADPKESTTAIATLALVRQMGTTVAPAILVGFTTARPGMEGYTSMMLAVVAFCAISLALSLLYRSERPKDQR